MKLSKMKLSVYSLKNILFQGSAASLNCKTTLGEITVLDNHETMIAVLVAGLIRIIGDDKKEHGFYIKYGFLEVIPGNEVRCIVEQ